MSTGRTEQVWVLGRLRKKSTICSWVLGQPVLFRSRLAVLGRTTGWSPLMNSMPAFSKAAQVASRVDYFESTPFSMRVTVLAVTPAFSASSWTPQPTALEPASSNIGPRPEVVNNLICRKSRAFSVSSLQKRTIISAGVNERFDSARMIGRESSIAITFLSPVLRTILLRCYVPHA
jgi:hypothetical protein